MSYGEEMVAHGLPWIREDHGKDEVWTVNIEGIHVWVKNYGDSISTTFSGWRAGRGGSPLSQLNGGEPFADREEAMQAGVRIARATALDKMRVAHEAMGKALSALSDVVLPL